MTQIAGLLALAAALHVAPSSASYPACRDGLVCSTVTPPDKPGMAFDCAHVTAAAGTERGRVYHMHGNDGVRSKAMFFDVMLQLAPLGYTSVACDARGYSPGAAPQEQRAYHYDELAGDIFSLVNATLGTGQFHLVTHDQGARVSWHAIARGTARPRLLSFTSLSIPHADVFSDSLIGPNADKDEQMASQYVRMLTLPNATAVQGGIIFTHVCQSEGWTTTAGCQRSLWWYNGAIDSGAMALAPMGPYGAAARYVGISNTTVAKLTQYRLDGVPQTVKVGPVAEFPVLYACGSQDPSDLCKQAYSDESAKLIANYTYLRVEGCSHNVLGCDKAQQYIDAIITHIQAATASWGQSHTRDG